MLNLSIIRKLRKNQLTMTSGWLILFCGVLILGSKLTMHQANAKDTFLDLVPSETPYFLNYKMNQQNLKMVPKQLPEVKQDLNKISSAREKLTVILLKDVISHYNRQKLADLGLRDLKEFHMGIYGLGLWPVLNFAVKKQADFTRWLVRSAKKAGVKVSKKKGALEIEVSSKVSLLLSYVSKSWVNLALIPKQLTSEMLPYLDGTKKPKATIVSSAQLNKWAKEISSSPENLAIFNFETLIKIFLNHGQGLNKRFGWLDDQVIKSVPQSCIADYLELAKAVPYLISGLRQDKAANTQGMVLLKFAPEIAQVTQTFLAQSAYTVRSADRLIELSFALNVKAVIDGLQKAFQAKIQKPFTCPHLLTAGLNPQKLQMQASKLMMIPPFVYDLIGLSLVVKEINPSPRAQLVINAKNISNLINIAKSMDPRFAQIKLPKVGAPAEALQGLPIPPQYKVMVQMHQNALGLSLGEGESSELKKVLSSKPEMTPAFFSIAYNLERILGLFKNFLNSSRNYQRKVKEMNYRQQLEQAKLNGTPLPSPPKFEDDSNPLDVLNDNLQGWALGFTWTFDSRGLFIRSNVATGSKP